MQKLPIERRHVDPVRTFTPPDLFFCYDQVPIAQDLKPLAVWLAAEGYTPHAVDRIVEHVGVHRTAACCGWLDSQEDADAAEALIPRDPRWDSPEWDQITFGITEA